MPLCVTLGCILAALSVAATWIKLTALDTDTYVDTVGPLVEDEAVTTALSTRLSDRLFTAVDVESTVEGLLPDRAQALAPALVAIVERYAADLLDRVVESDQFRTLWVEANRVAHTQIVKLLKGELVPTEAKQVVLDFGTTVQDLDARLQERGIELPIDRERINEAGQFVVATQEQLDTVRQAVEWLDRLAFVLPILTVIMFVLAILISRRRPRTLMWIGLGSIITFAILAIVIRLVRRTVINGIDDPITRDAADAIWSQLLSGLRTQVLVAVLLALVVAVAGWLLGGSKAAASGHPGGPAQRYRPAPRRPVGRAPGTLRQLRRALPPAHPAGRRGHRHPCAAQRREDHVRSGAAGGADRHRRARPGRAHRRASVSGGRGRGRVLRLPGRRGRIAPGRRSCSAPAQTPAP